MPRTKIIASIDAGSSKVATVVALMEEGDDQIRVLGSASTPSKGIKKGNIVTIDDATESIIQSVEAAERMAGYNLSSVIVGVNGSHIVSQNSRGVVAIADPQNEITHSDVERVIEAAKAISLPASREIVDVVTRSFTIDGQEGIADPIGMSGVRLEVETHIVTASAPAIKNLTKCVKETGASIVGLVAGGTAAAQTVLTDTEKELGVVLVDIGGGTTSIVIYA
ncbi:cell division protein FtsA, partial [Patescibacteria group bacterium]|nr:cell division protein FtsA [Patescibacteria group bacterium]